MFDRIDERRRICGCAHDHPHLRPGGLTIRAEKLPGRLPVQTMFHVLRDSDDRQPGVARIEAADFDALPQRVFIRPISPGHCLVDDYHTWRVLRIQLCKLSPADQPDTHRLEVIWTNNAVSGARLIFRAGIRFPFDYELPARISSSDGQMADGAD